MPKKFRLTSIGLYHLKRWMSDFAYLDAMLFDTPIFNHELINSMRSSCESFNIQDRYKRAIVFRDYLAGVWEKFPNKPSYFDLTQAFKMGEPSFDNVKRVVEK